MKFRAFKCECGWYCATPEEKPVCEECGREMKEIDQHSEEYVNFNTNMRNKLKVISG